MQNFRPNKIFILFAKHSAKYTYSSPEPSELSQWLCHDDSTVNIVVDIIIIIIIIIIMAPSRRRFIRSQAPENGDHLGSNGSPAESAYGVVERSTVNGVNPNIHGYYSSYNTVL